MRIAALFVRSENLAACLIWLNNLWVQVILELDLLGRRADAACGDEVHVVIAAAQLTCLQRQLSQVGARIFYLVLVFDLRVLSEEHFL